MPPDVSVIVVTWNARDHVDACLAAVLGPGGDGVDMELIVVDNASTDGTAEHVRRSFPAARVIETGRNGGMAAGNNAGMLAAEGRAFLLLNSDAFLDPGALRTMLDRLDAEPAGTVAAVAPALQNPDGTPQRSVRGFPTTWRYATEFFYLRRMAPGIRATNAFYGAGTDVEQPGFVDWVTGACLLVPRDSVDAVGLTFRTPDEAIEKANNTPYGLSAGVWTDKGSRILSMVNELRAGVVWANTFNRFDPTSPFGGYKESGYGREGGLHGLAPYLIFD